jgi:hypothetical protein
LGDGNRIIVGRPAGLQDRKQKNYTPVVIGTVNRGSSVSIVSGYGLDDRAIEVRSPAETKGFFL